MANNQIILFLQDYGIIGIVGVILTILITQLVKMPIKKWARTKAQDNNVSTKVYTWIIQAVAYGIALVFGFLGVWMASGFDLSILGENTFAWVKVLAEGSGIWGMSLALYSVFENALQANTSIEIDKLANASAESKVLEAKKIIAESAISTASMNAEKNAQEKAMLKAEKDAKKKAERDAKELAKAQEKALKEEQRKAKELADLEAQSKALQEKLNTLKTKKDPWEK